MDKVDLKKLCLNESTSLKEGMRVLNSSALQILLAVDNKNKLVGTLTDGDIRRGLLKGLSLDEPINFFMNRNFRFKFENQSEKQVKEYMLDQKIMRMPVLNSSKEVVDLILIEELERKKYKNSPVLIMAGGKGKRLRPFTENCPKPMLKVNDKPILEIVLENCISHGFNEFYISVNYLKDEIINYFEDGKKWHIKIDYLIEDKPLGTAGSLYLLKNKINQPIVVINGDVLTKLNLKKFIDFYYEQQADALIAVRDQKLQVQYGVVKNDGFNFIGIEEKPIINNLVNTGLYIINPSIIDAVNENEYLDMPNLLMNSKINGKKICIYPLHEYWLDIGIPETLNKANTYLHEDNFKKL